MKIITLNIAHAHHGVGERSSGEVVLLDRVERCSCEGKALHEVIVFIDDSRMEGTQRGPQLHYEPGTLVVNVHHITENRQCWHLPATPPSRCQDHQGAGRAHGSPTTLLQAAPSRPAPPSRIVTGEKALAAPTSAAATTRCGQSPSLQKEASP